MSYTVQLSTQPSADVTVVITGASDTDLTVTPASLTFTASTWDQAQTVTVSSAEDPDSTDDDVTLAHTATGGGYTNLSTVARVAVRVDDDENTAVADEPEDPGAPGSPVIRVVRTNATPQVAIYSTTVPPTAPTMSSASSNGSRATTPGWRWRAETGRTRCTPGRARA